MSDFKATKIKANSYALFEDGNEFARLTKAGDKWLLSTANTELKRVFNATVFAADATVKSILWAIRAMIEHLREIAAKVSAVIDETEGKLTNIGLYGSQVIVRLPVKV